MRLPTEEVNGDSVTVRLDCCTFVFRDIMCRTRQFEARLEVSRPVPDEPLAAAMWQPGEPFDFHISAHSLSNLTTYRRAIENYYGKDLEWERLIIRACKRAEAAYRSASNLENPDDYTVTTGPEHMIDDVLRKNQVNVVFGMGESAKSLVVQDMVQHMTAGAWWAGRHTINSRWLWLDYENPTKEDFSFRRMRLVLGMEAEVQTETVMWLWGRGIALPDYLATVEREMQGMGADGLVIDSAVFACGGDAIKQEVATHFFNSLNRLRTTTILIAHTDKAENDRMPFGSVFWHNGIHGLSWYVKKVAHAGSDELTVGFYNRKVSGGRKPHDFAVRVRFDGTVGPIRLEPAELSDEQELANKGNAWVRIWSALDGEMTYKQLAEATNLTEQGVKTALRRSTSGLVQTRYADGKAWVSKKSRHSDEDFSE